MNKLIGQAKVLWARLPHQVQAVAILFATASATVLSKEMQALIFGTAHFTRSTLQHDLGAACMAGIFAVRAFYMLPSSRTLQSDPTPVTK
jgi:hypothetical protein